ncbi:MAG: apolipoprotein N-acyltransferase, partial [Gallionellaceae bacterium]|nr:apolipoprotein N-acyltransferase [Gallionellaceae bacterium]
DAWFGDSFAPWQHLQIAQMRALETGRWWLKDNNTGITAVLDEKGRVVASLKPFTADVLDSVAQGMTGATPYSRWGNRAFLVLAVLALLGSTLLSRRR